MEIEVHKGPAPLVSQNGTNGHGNGSGHDGIAVPVVEALAPVTVPEPVVAAETAGAGGGESVSTDSESTGAQDSGGGEEAPRLRQIQRQLQDHDLVVFRPEQIRPVVARLVVVNMTRALAQRPEGNGRWSDRVRDAYGPARKTLDGIGETELKRRLQNIVRSGEDGHRFTFAQAKAIVYSFLMRMVYASRPFCRNHERPEGERRCMKRAAKAGDLCDPCRGKEKRLSARAPKQSQLKNKKNGCKACVKEGGPCKKHRRQAAAA